MASPGNARSDVRDASESAGVWELDADASRYTEARMQDITVDELQAARTPSHGAVHADVQYPRRVRAIGINRLRRQGQHSISCTRQRSRWCRRISFWPSLALILARVLVP